MHNADLKFKWQMLNEREENGFTAKKIMQFKDKLKTITGQNSSTTFSDLYSTP